MKTAFRWFRLKFEYVLSLIWSSSPQERVTNMSPFINWCQAGWQSYQLGILRQDWRKSYQLGILRQASEKTCDFKNKNIAEVICNLRDLTFGRSQEIGLICNQCSGHYFNNYVIIAFFIIIIIVYSSMLIKCDIGIKKKSGDKLTGYKKTWCLSHEKANDSASKEKFVNLCS